MQILRGSGPKRRALPFHYDPIMARKKAKLHRLVRKGLAPAGDKASLRAVADEAARSHHIRRVP